MAHQAVLLREALEQLDIKKNGVYLDATFGRGGHSRGILESLDGTGRLLALDRDMEAINSAEARLLEEDPRFSLRHGCFSDLYAIAASHGYAGKINGVLLDFGVSSPQLDVAERGFSFLRDGPLDMRMDRSRGMSAAEYLQRVDEQALAKVIFEYGEERYARRIARAIVEQRKQHALESTRQLAMLIENCVPFQDKFKHPATRTFQAIRMEINQELPEITTGLKQAVDVLAAGGRLVVIAFHSLEDRIVKRFIRYESGKKFNPGRLPIKEQDIEQGVLKKVGKAIRAELPEVRQNPRARSAVMRVAEKL
ncbi:MAG: 16S rRNA (cytosine(1402)-N(4))-methyltransferase RsmH [Methylomonas sp.]